MNKIEKLVRILNDKKLTISTCESATCGHLASTFGQVSGVSSVYKGGLITYSNASKVILAGVDPHKINEFGAVSEQVAEEMAIKTSQILETNICISITGNAGPNPMENKEVGRFWIGVSIFNNPSTHEVVIPKVKKRTDIIAQVTEAAIDLLISILSLSN